MRLPAWSFLKKWDRQKGESSARRAWGGGGGFGQDDDVGPDHENDVESGTAREDGVVRFISGHGST